MDEPQPGRSQNVFQVTEEIKEEPAGAVPSAPITQGIELSPSFIPPDESTIGDNGATGGGGVFKYILIFILVIALVVGGIFLFRNLKNRTGSQVVLNYWGLWEDESVLQPLINDYEKNNPNIKIKYTFQTYKQYRERLEAALQREGEVDIFRFHNTWVPMLKDQLAVIPEAIFPKKDYETIFYPIIQSDLKMGSGYAGIPLMIDGLALYYNEDILKAGGKAVPKTWDDLQSTAMDLTVKDLNGTIKTSGVALGTANNVEHFSDILAVMFLQNGANLKNPVGDEAKEALAYYRLFAEKPNNTWDEGQPNSIDAFAQGKVAMIFAPSWEAFAIIAKNPNLKFKTAPIPQLPGTNITWATYWVEGVSNKSKYQKESWAFLKFLSEKENLIKLFTEESKLRPFGEPYPRTDLAQTLATHPLIGSYVLQAPSAKSFPLASQTHDNGLNDRLIKYLEDAVNSLTSGSSPEAALKTAASGFQQVLSQYGLVAGAQPAK